MTAERIADDLAELRTRLPGLSGDRRQEVIGRVFGLAEALHRDGADPSVVADLLDFVLAGVAGHA